MQGTQFSLADERPRAKGRIPGASLLGRRFGRLLVTARSARGSQSAVARGYWVCACDCGRSHVANGRNLLDGLTLSCGCLISLLREQEASHKLASLYRREYNTWAAMKQRCLNPKNSNWSNYGGRGITVCQRWVDSFEDFMSDMGRRPPRMSIERIENDRGYEPGNCKWATSSEQNRNQRPRRSARGRGMAVSR